MQNKDNVYEQANQTEQGSEIERVEKEYTGSADLGKFKDVNALLQAYRALQAEFTRRSQRLKRYEEQENQLRQEEEIRRATIAEAGEDGNSDTVQTGENEMTATHETAPELPIEKLAAADGDGADALDRTEERPCSAAEEKIEKRLEAETVVPDPSTDGVRQSQTDGEKHVERECVAEQAAPSLYEQVMANEEVRLKVIGDYLSSIGKANAPLVQGGRGTLATPPKKSRTVSEAGNMALLYLKAQSEQV